MWFYNQKGGNHHDLRPSLFYMKKNNGLYVTILKS